MSPGQEDRSLSDLNIEFSEAKLTLESAAEEQAALKRQLHLAQEQVRSLTVSLAAATQEAEVFRRESAELKLRMEALGLDAASSDPSRLEQRLLKAVRDLALANEEREKIASALVGLCEAVVRLLSSVEEVDPAARADVESQMRQANEVLGLASPNAIEAQAYAATLTDALVIAIKAELALVVINVGRLQGAQPGMPFTVLRKGQPIGRVRLVDVRDRISGAVIEELENQDTTIKVGDLLRVDAR